MQKQIVAQQVSYEESMLAMSLKAKSADDFKH
jgi:general secretion pathway protein L